MNYDFSGWATRNDIKCSDGRTIRKDAFKDNDGVTVPLVWNHMHNDPTNVLGHALLENKEDGVYVYGTFNDTESGTIGRALVQHGDIVSLSIYANQLKQSGGDVLHGNIREVSLVHAGANPGAFIDTVIAHSDDVDEEAIIYTGEELEHSGTKKTEEPKEEPAKESKETEEPDEETIKDVFDTLTEKQKKVVYAIVGSVMAESGEDKELSHADAEEESDEDETIEDVFNTLSEKQKTAVYAIIGSILEDEGDEDMKHNVFESENTNETVLTHSDQTEIIKMAKQSSIGSLQEAIGAYLGNKDDELAHGFDGIEELFPDYKDVYPGFPELITRDQTWIDVVMGKIHKSPISRVRTRQTDVRDVTLRARGYDNAPNHAGRATAKQNMANVTFVKRTTDPQTVYIKDALHRDDIIDITDFDVVEYQYKIMRMLLNEEIALAILIGDGREESDDAKIGETHIRPIWTDNELYTIRGDVDIEAARTELQGTDTDKHFGENYIYAEAIITKALYLREKYKGTGTPDFYCTPHLLNVMLLARDLNGRRIYDSKADLAKALNVNEIYTVEQFEGRTRTEEIEGVAHTKKLLGIFVNLTDYQVGSTKGGEITKFSDFDIDFNQEKYLIETRLSGALTRIYSAIALEEDVTESQANPSQG